MQWLSSNIQQGGERPLDADVTEDSDVVFPTVAPADGLDGGALDEVEGCVPDAAVADGLDDNGAGRADEAEPECEEDVTPERLFVTCFLVLVAYQGVQSSSLSSSTTIACLNGHLWPFNGRLHLLHV